MSTALIRALLAQADRAPAEPDGLQMLADIHRRVGERGRRRKAVLGAGAGSAVVAGVVITTLFIGNAVGSSGGRDKHDAGVAPRSTTAIGTTASTSASAAATPPAKTPASPPTGAALASIAAAPKKAPLSLGLMPKGWVYVGENEAVTAYGPAGSKRGNSQAGDFVDKIVAEVGDRYNSEKFPITVAGYPARIYLTSDAPSIWIVDIAYNAKILLTIQVWRNAKLSRAQVLRMASTLAVRSVAHPAHG
jgi:hypothetical protein